MEINIEDVISRYNNYLCTVARNASNNQLSEEDIEEAVSDTYYILWKKQKDINEDTLRPYMATIVNNIIRNRFRNMHLENDIDDYEYLEANQQDISDLIIEDDRMKAINIILSELKLEDREIFVKFYYNDMKIKKIAKEFKLSEINVKVKLHRIRKEIRDGLRKRGYSYGK